LETRLAYLFDVFLPYSWSYFDRIDVCHGHGKQFIAAVAQSLAGSFIDVEKAACFRLNHLDSVVLNDQLISEKIQRFLKTRLRSVMSRIIPNRLPSGIMVCDHFRGPRRPSHPCAGTATRDDNLIWFLISSNAGAMC